MTVRLYNTLSRTLETLKPLSQDEVTLYTCGLTVYSQPQIGNWVAYIYWDILVRTLIADGYKVNRVQNITDVGHLTDDGDTGEDKMQKGALREGKTAWDVAQKYADIAYDEAYNKLGLLVPTHMPKATDFIEQQIDYVKQLEEAGYTYVIKDGVYFDTSKLADYGKLAKLDIKGLRFGARVADTGKKHPTDFAVWKFSPEDEKRDMEWSSPWGEGFPGWHLECSVMAMELLGKQIDIHTGGIDHIPVHHTNEIAQTEALTHTSFANIWMHNNHLKVNGTKLSKSLGNSYTLTDLVEKGYDLDAFKLLVLSKHYRSEGNFTWEILDAASNRLIRWRNIAVLRWQTHDTLEDDDDKDSSHDVNGVILAAPHAALDHLRDDLGTPEALAVIERAFENIEQHSIRKIQKSALVALLEWIEQTLGVRLLGSTPDINDEAKQTILERASAREAKDWQRSDELRDLLASRYQIKVLDTNTGPVWQYIDK
ncbi:MAG TPA: cysteine--tRNA ligase [Candidatus Saccharimonadales bacterium]